MNMIIGKKILQTQAFLTNGARIPVTFIEVPDNVVLSVKSVDVHGYNAVQLGYGSRKNSKKPLMGHSKKANLTASPLVVKEARLNSDEAFGIGDTIAADLVFKMGDIIKVTGLSKGKGFAGVVKRHNFRGGPRTHGQSDRERAPGSIGQTTTPGRVYKGKKMAGRMGHAVTSILNLQVLAIEEKGGKKIVLVKGLIPGALNSIVTIEKTGELSEKKVTPLMRLDKVVSDGINTETSIPADTAVKADVELKDAQEGSVDSPEVAKSVIENTEENK